MRLKACLTHQIMSPDDDGLEDRGRMRFPTVQQCYSGQCWPCLHQHCNNSASAERSSSQGYNGIAETPSELKTKAPNGRDGAYSPLNLQHLPNMGTQNKCIDFTNEIDKIFKSRWYYLDRLKEQKPMVNDLKLGCGSLNFQVYLRSVFGPTCLHNFRSAEKSSHQDLTYTFSTPLKCIGSVPYLWKGFGSGLYEFLISNILITIESQAI